VPEIFTRGFRVRWSETDAQGYVDITSYLRYLVETAWDWGAAGGISLEESHALGIVWVMRQTQFEFFSPLRFNDCFDFTIWMLQWRRVRGTRAFELRLQDGGQVVAQGAQQVVVLDSQTMRPTSLPRHLLEFYVLEEPRAILIKPFPKLAPAPESAFVMERRVEGRDVDQVGIIDNTVFGAFAEEAAARALAAAGWSPEELKARELLVQPRCFHILHQTPAVWGDRLRLSVYLRALEDAGGEWVITVERPNGGAAIGTCTLRWALVDRATGEPQPLPESLSDKLQGWVAAAD
jgi:acyl-CoA thioester hydrolase